MNERLVTENVGHLPVAVRLEETIMGYQFETCYASAATPSIFCVDHLRVCGLRPARDLELRFICPKHAGPV